MNRERGNLNFKIRLIYVIQSVLLTVNYSFTGDGARGPAFDNLQSSHTPACRIVQTHVCLGRDVDALVSYGTARPLTYVLAKNVGYLFSSYQSI